MHQGQNIVPWPLTEHGIKHWGTRITQPIFRDFEGKGRCLSTRSAERGHFQRDILWFFSMFLISVAWATSVAFLSSQRTKEKLHSDLHTSELSNIEFEKTIAPIIHRLNGREGSYDAYLQGVPEDFHWNILHINALFSPSTISDCVPHTYRYRKWITWLDFTRVG